MIHVSEHTGARVTLEAPGTTGSAGTTAGPGTAGGWGVGTYG